MTNTDHSQQLVEQVNSAYQNKKTLKIQAGNSKKFYGRDIQADLLDVSSHQGIISYEPSELVIQVRSGSKLKDIVEILDNNNQILAFEPPSYSSQASIGGTIACNLSGPRRAYTGPARDYVLGCNIINGKAETIKFGGEVIKNVAGYDAARLMCGAMGTLGVILDVSLKVIPKPETELTLVHNCNFHLALDNIHKWYKQALPISASCYDGKSLIIRLSGNQASVSNAKKLIGGDVLAAGTDFWNPLREMQHPFFDTEKSIWRLSIASNTPEIKLFPDTLVEWGGALRWVKSSEEAEVIRHHMDSLGGHATLYKNNPHKIAPFHPLSLGLKTIHKNLKNAFDPENILNPARMYQDI